MSLWKRRAYALVLGAVALTVPAVSIASNAAAVRSSVLRSEAVRPSDYLAAVDRPVAPSMQANDTAGRPPSLDLEKGDTAQSGAVKPKSPLRAFMYSLLVPGAGQVYTGSKLKAAAFLGLEALAWTGYFVYHAKGNENTDVYEAFADQHWSEDRYSDFLEDNFANHPRDDDSAFDNSGNPYFTHHLPDTKTQQYYEMIGKYNQFVFGWDDVDTIATPPLLQNIPVAQSANRQHYEDLRDDANRMYGRATASLIVMMSNHIISGVEAALAARNHNKKAETSAQKLTVRAVTARVDDTYFPMLTATYSF